MGLPLYETAELLLGAGINSLSGHIGGTQDKYSMNTEDTEK